MQKKRSRRSASASSDGEESGHYSLATYHAFGEHQRYRPVRVLGEGTFARVVEMVDTFANASGPSATTTNNKPPHTVAVKVIRKIDKYRKQAYVEAKILERLTDAFKSKPGLGIVRLLGTFEERGHFCMVMPVLGPSLYELLQRWRRDRPSPRAPDRAVDEWQRPFCSLGTVRRVALDCSLALEHLHALGIVHTDLKMENILLRPGCRQSFEHGLCVPGRPLAACFTIVDFGGATSVSPTSSSIVCTRQYRPPEVTLRLGWREPVDVWSLACVLAELWTTDLLFRTHDEVEHLALIERLLGALPEDMLLASAELRMGAEKYTEGGALRWPELALNRASEERVRAQPRLRDAIAKPGYGCRRQCWMYLFNTLGAMLEYRPADRVMARNVPDLFLRVCDYCRNLSDVFTEHAESYIAVGRG